MRYLRELFPSLLGLCSPQGSSYHLQLVNGRENRESRIYPHHLRDVPRKWQSLPLFQGRNLVRQPCLAARDNGKYSLAFYLWPQIYNHGRRARFDLFHTQFTSL